MANVGFHPDPYQGWSVCGGVGNVTAYQLMNDTSGTWSLTQDFGSFRIYTRR